MQAGTFLARQAAQVGASSLRPGRVICVQLGAREDYAVARALWKRRALSLLLTDAWMPCAGLLRRALPTLAGRSHRDLAGAPVVSETLAAVSRETWLRLRGVSGWPKMTAKNRWFQQMAVRRLGRLGIGEEDATVFAYSYAARDVHAHARRRGWRTILGQIDAGPVEDEIVIEERQRYPDLAPDWASPPAPYWEAWRDEVALADCIVVNSEWSRGLLSAAGVPAERLEVIPLAYDPPPEAAGFRRRYPRRFDSTRPLRVLFLGQVNVRKGAARILEAARLLRDAPVEFHFVGPMQISPQARLAHEAPVIWHGPVPRSRVHRHYRDADVFLLPTLSDGFGLTQLEARAWRLPLIVSNRCAGVVEDGVSGLIVEPPSADTIAAAIERCLDAPGWLQSAADAIAPGERFGLDALGDALARIL